MCWTAATTTTTSSFAKAGQHTPPELWVASHRAPSCGGSVGGAVTNHSSLLLSPPSLHLLLPVLLSPTLVLLSLGARFAATTAKTNLTPLCANYLQDAARRSRLPSCPGALRRVVCGPNRIYLTRLGSLGGHPGSSLVPNNSPTSKRRKRTGQSTEAACMPLWGATQLARPSKKV